MSNGWLWKALLIPAWSVLALGVLGLCYPSVYMTFYLRQTAGTTLDAFASSQPDISLLLEVLFSANGLGMTMSGILAVFVILYAVRKGEKWSIPALAIAGGIGLVGEIILEAMVL